MSVRLWDAQALLRAASSDGFQPSHGRDPARRRVTLVPMLMEQASESGAILEIPDGT
jgi:hypothetical protein